VRDARQARLDNKRASQPTEGQGGGGRVLPSIVVAQHWRTSSTRIFDSRITRLLDLTDQYPYILPYAAATRDGYLP